MLNRYCERRTALALCLLSYRFSSLSAAKVQLLFQLTIRYEEFTVILERFWPISGFKTWEDADHAEIKDLIKSRL